MRVKLTHAATTRSIVKLKKNQPATPSIQQPDPVVGPNKPGCDTSHVFSVGAVVVASNEAFLLKSFPDRPCTFGEKTEHKGGGEGHFQAKQSSDEFLCGIAAHS